MESNLNRKKSLKKVIEKVGWQDIEKLYSRKNKIKRNGVILIALGILLPFLVVALHFIFPSFFNLTFFMGGVFLAFLVSGTLVKYGYSLFLYQSERVFSPAGGRYSVYKRIECTKCDHVETTGYETGDYVGKKLDKKCSECGGNVRVTGIIGEPEHKIETIGMPVLPGAGGSMGVLDKIFLTLDKIIPVSTILTKLFRKSKEK